MKRAKKNMLPHQEAIEKVKSILEEENGVDVVREKRGLCWRMVPDLTFRGEENKLTVVEVGMVSPDKILRYQEQKDIAEIRWYSTSCELAGMWIRLDGIWFQMKDRRIGRRWKTLLNLDRLIEERKREFRNLG